MSGPIAGKTVRGIVINLNAFGATVRLEDGGIVSAVPADIEARRPEYERAWNGRKPVLFECREGRRTVVVLAPQIDDEVLDDRIATYLKSIESWDSPDGVPAHERHFLRKKKRAALFEGRSSTGAAQEARRPAEPRDP